MSGGFESLRFLVEEFFEVGVGHYHRGIGE